MMVSIYPLLNLLLNLIWNQYDNERELHLAHQSNGSLELTQNSCSP